VQQVLKQHERLIVWRRGKIHEERVTVIDTRADECMYNSGKDGRGD